MGRFAVCMELGDDEPRLSEAFPPRVERKKRESREGGYGLDALDGEAWSTPPSEASY